MKRLIFIFLFIPYLLGATDYYVKNGGNNALAGTSDATAWETLAKINATSFFAGDIIRFKAGDTFRGYLWVPSSGASGNPITFTSYGAGAKPKIIGGDDRSSSANWTNYSGNVWRTASLPAVLSDASNVIMNNEVIVGKKETAIGSVNIQGDWFYNTGDDRIYMYSVGNPGTFYTHIEVCGLYSENIFSVISHDYITIDGLDIRYSANNGIFISESDNVIVQNCDVSWIGGMYYYGGPARMGNGIQMWDNVNYITVRYNYVHDIYDTGISPQGDGVYTQTNVNMYYNVFDRCNWTYEIFVGGTGTRTLTNISFNNNTCLNAGSWSNNQRPDTDNATHVKTWDENNCTRTNLTIKNNIFSVSNYTGLTHYYTNVFDCDYNLFYLTYIGFIFDTFYSTLASWRTAIADDYNSISDNPDLNGDFTLQATSPAIDNGTPLGYTRDYFGNIIQGNPDIGAFEYGETSTTKYANLVIEGHSFVAPGTWGAYYLPLETDVQTQHNTATSGAVYEIINNRASTVDSYLVTETPTLKNVLVIWAGVNDLSYIVGEGATHYALYKSYVQARLAAGWTVFYFTITPSTGYGRGAQFEIERNVFNGLLRSDLDALTGVYVLDTDVFSELDDPTNTTYYTDELHLTQAGMFIASGLFGDAVTAFFAGTVVPGPPEPPTGGIVVSGGKIVVHNGKIVIQ